MLVLKFCLVTADGEKGTRKRVAINPEKKVRHRYIWYV